MVTPGVVLGSSLGEIPGSPAAGGAKWGDLLGGSPMFSTPATAGAGPAYDVIVVGARCGGSPTAMLLARKGYRVLLVDKATFPSDTMSTHLAHPPAVAALGRWGIL